jgi:hypothetical protein
MLLLLLVGGFSHFNTGNENLLHVYAAHNMTYRVSHCRQGSRSEVMLLVSVKAQYCSIVQYRKFGCGI